MIDAVVFNVGETLVNETRDYGTWADWLGVPRYTFSAVFGAVIALRMDHRDLFATSDDRGASKPDQSFFRALISAAPCEASRIVYIGDRLDNYLKPAKDAGMRTRPGCGPFLWRTSSAR